MVKKFIIFLFFICSPLTAKEIIGIPKIIDGDTLHIDRYKIRFESIDAPEMRQVCKRPYLKISTIIGFNFDKSYNCGVVSKKQLAKKIDNSEVKCITSSKDRYKRYLATCYKDKLNLNKWMVRQGYAVAYRRYSKQYLIDEKYAKENKLGIWQGTFLRPENWRKLN